MRKRRLKSEIDRRKIELGIGNKNAKPDELESPILALVYDGGSNELNS